jgi:hypothetical protein
MSTSFGIFSTQYRTLFLEIHRAIPPVVDFTIFNDRGGLFAASVAQLNVAPLVPGSASHNDGFPLSKLPFGSRFVFCAAAPDMQSNRAIACPKNMRQIFMVVSLFEERMSEL